MATIMFDTLKFANTLKDAGVPSAQAEAEAKGLKALRQASFDKLRMNDFVCAGENGCV